MELRDLQLAFLRGVNFAFYRHLKTYWGLTRVTCKKVRLIYPEGLKRCFEDFISTRNSLIIKFDRVVTLCAPCDSESY